MPKSEPTDIDDRPSAVPWPPLLLAGLIGAALAFDRWVVPLPIPFAETALLRGAGGLLLAAGFGLMVWAMVAFRLHATTIRPDRGASNLITARPFAWSRNPIYLGETAALVGAALAFNRLTLAVAAVAFAAGVTRLAIRPEEAHLERRFGDAYRAYAARVRRWV